MTEKAWLNIPEHLAPLGASAETEAGQGVVLIMADNNWSCSCASTGTIQGFAIHESVGKTDINITIT